MIGMCPLCQEVRIKQLLGVVEFWRKKCREVERQHSKPAGEQLTTELARMGSSGYLATKAGEQGHAALLEETAAYLRARKASATPVEQASTSTAAGLLDRWLAAARDQR